MRAYTAHESNERKQKHMKESLWNECTRESSSHTQINESEFRL